MDKLHLATRRTTLGMVRPMFAYELWLEKIAPNLKRDIIYPEYYNKKSFLDIDGTEKIFRQSQRVALTRFGFNTIYPSLRKTKWYDNRTKKSLKKFIDKINKTSPNVPIMSFHDSILYAIGSQDDEKNKSRKIGTHVNDLLVRDHHIKSKYGSHFMVPIKNWNPEVDRFGGKSLENILRDNISEVPISEGFLVDPNLLDGVKQERKLVPTRWSITATDDMIGKKLIDEVNDFSMIQDYSIHFGGYLGNNYLIAFFPDSWSYELFENYIGDPKNPDPSVFETGTDFEGYYGRKTYATNTVGGYYATRLAILEHLKRNKRKSTVLALRFITDEYWMPLGVWVVREATRKALANKPLKLNSKEEVLRYIELFIRRKFSFKFDDIKSKSKLIKNLMMQKKLFEF